MQPDQSQKKKSIYKQKSTPIKQTNHWSSQTEQNYQFPRRLEAKGIQPMQNLEEPTDLTSHQCGIANVTHQTYAAYDHPDR